MGDFLLDIPPGCVKESSKARNTSNWRESHLIRWDGNTLLPIKGWEYTDYAGFASPCRAIHKWVTNTNLICVAYLCEQHCYVDIGDGIVDITPVGGFPPPASNRKGYGDLKYNATQYGTPRIGESRLTNNTPAYTLNNWGDELRAMISSDGRLLRWDPNAAAGTKLTAVANAPISNRSFTVTPERHIMLFGMGGKADQFGWCDQENDQDWTFTNPLNKAGFYDLEPSAPIVAHCQFFGGILMFTMASAFIIKNIGLPYIYNYQEIGKPPVPINAQCITEGPEGIMWPSIDGFWVYNGNSVAPIPCPIWDDIRDNIDFHHSMFYATVVNVMSKNELWWFVSDIRDTESFRSTRLVILEYRRGWWSMGKLARSAGFSYPNDASPIMTDDTKVLRHEVGFNYPGAEYPWVESFSMNVSDGFNFVTIHQILPEIIGDQLAIQFKFIKKMNRVRQDDEIVSPPRQPYDLSMGRIDIRETARDFRMRVEMVKPAPWTLGPLMIDARARGRGKR